MEDQEEYKVGDCKPPIEHQFKPGQSGNPAGKPKGTRTLTAILRDIVDSNAGKIFGDKIPAEMKGKTCGELLMLKLIALGIKDDRIAIGDVIDRLEGRPLQKQEVKTDIRMIEVEIVPPKEIAETVPELVDEIKDQINDSIPEELGS